jgi:protein involved in polysaccharide export with SLBB domain
LEQRGWVTAAKEKAIMTRGKLLFMFAGLCVVAILLWIASMLQTSVPGSGIASGAGGAAAVPAANALPAQSGDFYIAGHVHHTGMFSLKPGETLKDVITDAGGADSAPAELVVRLVRKDGAATNTRSIPLPDVLSGSADEKVVLGDVIDIVQQAKPATVQVPPASGVDAPTSSGLVTPPGSQ